jgi:hypothetical protein
MSPSPLSDPGVRLRPKEFWYYSGRMPSENKRPPRRNSINGNHTFTEDESYRSSLSDVEIEPGSFSDIIYGMRNVQFTADETFPLIEKKNFPHFGGCADTVGGAPNCTRACADNSLLFGSRSTLKSCVTLSTVAFLAQNGKISVGSAFTEMMAEIGVRDVMSFNGTQVLDGVTKCIVATCRDMGISACTESTLALRSTNIGPGSLPAIYTGLAEYCDNVDIGISSDIAGPGVCGAKTPNPPHSGIHHV